MTRKRALAAVLAAALLTTQALATWSIVVVSKKTGEVAVATATCIEGFGLETRVPLVVVGEGAAAAQAFVLGNAANRKIIFKGFKAGKIPARILDEIVQSDVGIDQRQFGIVSFLGEPVTFSGAWLTNPFSTSQWAGGLVGETDELAYAIQGNVLTGQPVVDAAEAALLAAPGDLSQKLLAAMQAARAFGGDGRCSCHPSDADSCGSPPPSFTKSAHQAVMVVARPGDTNGGCQGSTGCVAGEYWFFATTGGDDTDPDPVIQLQDVHAQWRTGLAGVPDHYRSEIAVDRHSLVADGASTAHVTVRLVDVNGDPLQTGGHVLAVKKNHSGLKTASVGAVVDHGDGTYGFDLTATTNPGRGSWNVDVLTAGARVIRLQPPLIVSTDALAELHAGVYNYHVATDDRVPFTVNRGAADALRPYRILGSFSGTDPGFDLGALHVPLNRDRLFQFTWTTSGALWFEGSAGLLDADGRAEASLWLSDDGWSQLVGERLHFTAWLGGPFEEVTNLVTFKVLP